MKISKRVREEAVLMCELAASSRSEFGFPLLAWVADGMGRAHLGPEHRLALEAWARCGSSGPSGGMAEIEAAALLRDGWCPGDPVVLLASPAAATGEGGECEVVDLTAESVAYRAKSDSLKELVRRGVVRAPSAPSPVVGEAAPIPMRLPCPSCGALHIDEGEFATKRHHTHSCQSCGMTWRPAVVATVGVQFLPGFKNVDPRYCQYSVPYGPGTQKCACHGVATAAGAQVPDARAEIEMGGCTGCGAKFYSTDAVHEHECTASIATMTRDDAPGAGGMTVGEALRETHVIEFRMDGWMQVRADHYQRTWRDDRGRWSEWFYCGRPDDAQRIAPCRLVPLATADDSPESRGPVSP